MIKHFEKMIKHFEKMIKHFEIMIKHYEKPCIKDLNHFHQFDEIRTLKTIIFFLSILQ